MKVLTITCDYCYKELKYVPIEITRKNIFFSLPPTAGEGAIEEIQETQMHFCDDYCLNKYINRT